MKRTVIERNIAVVLFIIVLITFSFAQRDSKKMESIYSATEVIHKTPLAIEKPAEPAQNNATIRY